MRKTAVALPDLLAPKKFRILLNSNFQNQFQNIKKKKKKIANQNRQASPTRGFKHHKKTYLLIQFN